MTLVFDHVKEVTKWIAQYISQEKIISLLADMKKLDRVAASCLIHTLYRLTGEIVFLRLKSQDIVGVVLDVNKNGSLYWAAVSLSKAFILL